MGGAHGHGAGQVERPLLAALQLQIDHGQQVGVDQRPVLLAPGQADLHALTEGVQGVVHPRELLLRHRQGIDPAVVRRAGFAAAFQLGVDEAPVEGRIVRHQGVLADELQEGVDHRRMMEAWLVLQVGGADAMHLLGVRIDGTVRLDILVEFTPRGHVVDDLDAGDLDDPVTGPGIQPRGFGVEYDVPRHRPVLGWFVAARPPGAKSC